MKRVLRQWLAGLLSVVLVLTLLPVVALAEESDGITRQTAAEQVQALIDALPDAESITADNRDDVKAQLTAIDEAKLGLSGEEVDALDTARYLAAVEALLALDGMSGADEPETMDTEVDVSVSEAPVNISTDGTYTITGSSDDGNTITVNTSGTVTITLNNVTVKNSNFCAFDIKSGNVTLILAANTENTFESGSYYAGIHVAAGASLTIEGSGTLKAVSKAVPGANSPHDKTIGAGIGGNGEIGGPEGTTGKDSGDNAGAITIKSGTIYAKSEGDGAGIGGGWTSENSKKNGQFESITITGGTVHAESMNNGAGIGSGCWAKEMGTINITGGEIHAKTAASAGQAYDIGAGHGQQKGRDINITGGVVYTENRGIFAYSGRVWKDNTIIFSSGKGEVYGNVTLNSDLTIQNNQTLHIPEESSLTVSGNHTLTVKDNATLKNDGVLDNKGTVKVEDGATLENNGLLNNEGTVEGGGTLTGSGEVIGDPIKMDYYVSVTVPAFESARMGDYQPEAQPITIQNKGAKLVTISSVTVDGNKFTVEPADSTSIEIQPGNTDRSYKISPNEDLSGGLHTATVTVTYDGGRKAVAKVSFMVHHFAVGEGTSESPYQIRDLDELEKFRDFINDNGNCGGQGMYFELMQDIDMEYGEGPSFWEPIGKNSYGFCGTFDGGGHKISGLYINSNSNSNSAQGLFAENAGTISNLNVSGTIICGEKSYTGIIVGMNGGTVTGCNSSGSVTVEDKTGSNAVVMIGGIVGQNVGAVTACTSAANVTVTAGGNNANNVMCGAGGIVGVTIGGMAPDDSDIQPTVTNCAFSGKVTGSVSGGTDTRTIMVGIGGVVGLNQASRDAVTVESCSNSGVVSGSGAMSDAMTGVGGIMGFNMSGGGTVLVKNCLNTGTVSDDISGGVSGAGGIVGTNLALDQENAAVENCCNTGSVTGTGGAVSGAIVGINSAEMSDYGHTILLSGTVRNCYYLSGAASGIGKDEGDGEAMEKSSAQFASGEVAYLLQNGQGAQVWGQTVGTGTPELTQDGAKKVYKITGKVEEQADVVWYSNSSAALPTAPSKEGYTFTGWSTQSGGNVDFTANTEISADMTVYAVFAEIHQKVDGTGSVTMDDYTCGDDSVKPVAQSETNGTGNVTFSYKVKGAPDSTYNSEKPLTAGEYTVRAVFPATDGYNQVTATADFRITHKFPANLEEDAEFSCGCLSELRLEAERLTQVPEELRDIYSDVETLTRAMVRQLSAGSNYAVYDVKLEVRQGSGAWQDAPEGSIPDEGITVTLPYPQGTDAGYVFTVVHMFAYGDRAGETETPAVTNTARGITFTVTGLSPVCVGWTYPYHAGTGSAAPSMPHYGVTTPPVTSGGEVAVSPKSAQPGTKVTVTVTPEAGHHLGTITVTDSAGRAVEVTDNGDGTYTFTMPYGQVNVSTSFVECSSLNFTDLNITAWYHGYTDYVLANGLMHGKGNNRFAPEGTVTRAEMVTTLWNLRGNPVVNYYMTYSDVDEESWYSEAVRWASSEGIAQGYGNGKFGPNDDITREQMAVMLYRYEQKYGSGGFTGAWMYLVPFDDLESISDWAFEAVAWCNMRGVIEGKSGNMFDPKGPARRSELAAVLTRYGTGE